MRAIYLNIYLFFSFPLFLISQSFPESTIVKTRNIGPFYIGKNNQKVTVSIDKAYLPESDAHDRSPSDFCLSVKNVKGKILYSEVFYYDGTDAVEFDVDTLKLFGNENGLIIFSNYSPTIPSDGTFAKIIGVGNNGKLLRMTRGINSTGGFIPTIIDKTLCLQVEQWSDNFRYLNYYVIHKNGKYKEDESAYPLKIYQVQIDTNSTKEERMRFSKEKEFIKLYPKPTKEKNGYILLEVNKNTSIKYLDAQLNNYVLWLRIKINNQEGFISDDADLGKIGLPGAN